MGLIGKQQRVCAIVDLRGLAVGTVFLFTQTISLTLGCVWVLRYSVLCGDGIRQRSFFLTFKSVALVDFLNLFIVRVSFVRSRWTVCCNLQEDNYFINF